ncbi:hypothetical protein EGR_01637 [Echinococcus granulosus]|uniref:Uncharacterized protein n=1 Tax=Echinococcus granulosus TaxID=6210 RepID=W6UPK6_ECHGR|nr:hypothetical protein EGR_01637 [Echinococcus granulosus]EUB63555.1 hypothetical protein EGR_01637 [Echinococcus granulosus]
MEGSVGWLVGGRTDGRKEDGGTRPTCPTSRSPTAHLADPSQRPIQPPIQQYARGPQPRLLHGPRCWSVLTSYWNITLRLRYQLTRGIFLPPYVGMHGTAALDRCKVGMKKMLHLTLPLVHSDRFCIGKLDPRSSTEIKADVFRAQNNTFYDD